MRKRFISLILICALALFLLPLTALASGSLSNLTKTRTYNPDHFSDVTDQWFAPDVQSAYEYALVDGTSPTTYSPSGNLTIAQAVKLAACLNDIYTNGALTLKNGSPLWYQTYVDYALATGIIHAPYPDYSAFATRADMALIFAGALPNEALAPLNDIPDNTVPDVSMNDSYSAAIYKLYRAGVLTGVDDTHAYRPTDSITRAEVAAIVVRMADSQARISFTVSPNGSTSSGTSTNGQNSVPLTLNADKTALSVNSGAQATVNFTVSSHSFSRIITSIGDSSVVSCTWGIPSNNTYPMTVYGLSGGSTAITVQLRDASDKVLAQAVVNVTVTGNGAASSTKYFPGYYPVPDYGAYVGTAPNNIDYDAVNVSTFYTYRVSDLTVDMNFAVNGYITLLQQNGFSLDESFKTPDGSDVSVFKNSVYRLKVFFTNAKMNNVPSIIVKATPY